MMPRCALSRVSENWTSPTTESKSLSDSELARHVLKRSDMFSDVSLYCLTRNFKSFPRALRVVVRKVSLQLCT